MIAGFDPLPGSKRFPIDAFVDFVPFVIFVFSGII
jgi:hypothetical protein